MKKNITKEIIIEKNLELIKKLGSGEQVNLRKIARELGCNHTNIYNFFDNRAKLQQETLKVLFEKYVAFRKEAIEECKSEKNTEEIVRKFLSKTVIFTLENRGWYRFAWLDEIESEVFFLVGKRDRYDVIVEDEIKALYPEMNEEKLFNNIGILHAYFVGEMLKYISNRSTHFSTEQEFKTNIVENTISLMKILFED